MKSKMLFPAVIVAAFLLSLSGCSAQTEKDLESGASQAERNAKVSINIVGGEDTPAESGTE